MKISFLLVLAGTRFSSGESTPRPPTKSLSLEQDVMFRHHASNVRSQSSNIEDIAITVNGKNCSLVCTFLVTLSPTLLHLFLTFPGHCPCLLPLKINDSYRTLYLAHVCCTLLPIIPPPLHQPALYMYLALLTWKVCLVSVMTLICKDRTLT